MAVVAAGSLLAAGSTGTDPTTVVAMLIGGVIASPIAAWTVRFVPARLLGLLVAGLLLITNARELAIWAGVGGARWAAYTAIVAVVALAAAAPQIRARINQRATPLASA